MMAKLVAHDEWRQCTPLLTTLQNGAHAVDFRCMNTQRLRLATALALGTAIISGTANFLNKYAVTAVKDPVVFTTLKNSIVALFLIGAVILFKQWLEIRSLTRPQWTKLLAIGIIGGSIPFALFFSGLAKTSALNAGLIHKTLFLWVLLFGIPFLKERLTRIQWLGIAAIFGANLFVGGFTGFKFSVGEAMILAATVLWGIENIIAKVALRDISSLTVAAGRMVFGSILLAFFVAGHGGAATIAQLTPSQWGWTLLTSGLLLGYVLTWYTALKHAPATYVATLLVPATLVTNVLSAVFVTHAVTKPQLYNGLLLIIGAVLVIAFRKKIAGGAETNQQLSPQSVR